MIDPFTTIVTQEDEHLFVSRGASECADPIHGESTRGNRLAIVTDGAGGYEIEVQGLGYKYAVPCTGKQLVDLAHKILDAHRRKGV